ncbi:MAG TPA: GAF domain-containing protein, partial [Anaerolineaceae bacterium]
MEENKQQAYDEILVRLLSDPEIAYGSLDPAFRAIAETCSQAADLDRFTVWRPTAIETEYQCVEAYNRAQNTHTSGDILLINQYPSFFSSLRNHRFTSIRQVESDPRAAGLAEEYWRRQRIESALCVPLWIRGRLDGMISLERQQPGRDWEEAVEAFACQVADLVVSVILAGESTALKQQADLFETTIDDLTRGTDPDIAVRRLLRYGAELLDCDSALLFLNDAHRRQCCLTAAYNAPASYDQAILAYGEDAAGTAAETGQALVLNNYSAWSRRSPRFAAEGFAEVMAAPLHMGAKVTGVLQGMRKDSDRPFDEEDSRMLERVARQAAVAVDQSRQRDRRARDEAHSEAVGRMIGIATQASDLTDMVDASLDLI